MGVIGSTTRTAGRLTPWARWLAAAEVALTMKRHLDRLDDGEPTELGRLLTKSKGRRKNLTKRERDRVVELIRKLGPGEFAKTAARQATPLRRKK